MLKIHSDLISILVGLNIEVNSIWANYSWSDYMNRNILLCNSGIKLTSKFREFSHKGKKESHFKSDEESKEGYGKRKRITHFLAIPVDDETIVSVSLNKLRTRKLI